MNQSDDVKKTHFKRLMKKSERAVFCSSYCYLGADIRLGHSEDTNITHFIRTQITCIQISCVHVIL